MSQGTLDLVQIIGATLGVLLTLLGGLWAFSRAYHSIRGDIRGLDEKVDLKVEALHEEIAQGKTATSKLGEGIEEAVLRFASAQRTMGTAEAWAADAKQKSEAALKHLDVEIRPELRRLDSELSELRGGLKVRLEGVESGLQSLVVEVRAQRGSGDGATR